MGATYEGVYESLFEEFEKITFTKASDKNAPYVFTIKEESSDALPGIVYNTSEVTITIEVTDIDGQLVKTVKTEVTESPETGDAEVTVDPEGVDTTATKDLVTVSVSFTNIYEVIPTTYTPPVNKVISVEYGPIVAHKFFNFESKLVSATNEVKQADGTTKTIDVTDGASIKNDTAQVEFVEDQETGRTEFHEITFSKAGTYVYEITETAKDSKGIIYDTTVWTLTIIVVDTDNILSISKKDGGDAHLPYQHRVQGRQDIRLRA